MITGTVSDCFPKVRGADQKLFNNATMVVLMREGTRTVLSMQNNSQGPPENFAMVVPVPIVLQKENVKTLPKEVFDPVDKLAAPRLVEYWEQDPCPEPVEREAEDMMVPASPSAQMAVAGAAPPRDYGVKIEAQFTVGEYEIVILSANASTGLDRWLKDNGYRIPAGAEPLLRPYVQGGMKFFVAKVDAKKVRFENGMADLSPLRFHHDAETFNLPIRLGLVNSAGTQDLIVHILARGKRCEVANYKNVTIPTNIDVVEDARKQSGALYAALFDRTVEKNPGAVLGEGGISNFQGRYAIRHPWKGPIKCSNPRRGVWGGPPPGVEGNTGTQVAQDLAFAPAGAIAARGVRAARRAGDRIEGRRGGGARTGGAAGGGARAQRRRVRGVRGGIGRYVEPRRLGRGDRGRGGALRALPAAKTSLIASDDRGWNR